MKGSKLILFYLLFSITLSLSAQDRQQLEQQRMQVIESIEATDSLIAASESDRQKGLATLAALRVQISQRNTLLENIRKSISAAELEIESNQVALAKLQSKVKTLQEQYGLLLKSQYVRKLASSKWLTILSASSINEAFLRWNYQRQFESYRKSKIDELESIKSKIAKKNEETKNFALENSALIQQQQIQNSELQNRIAQQNDLLKELEKDKTILQGQLSAIKNAREKLNRAIESKVMGELSGIDQGSNDSVSDTDTQLVKGKVLLPITNGYVEDLSIDQSDENKSVSIFAAIGASVISIAQGSVVSVKKVDGYGKMLILQHGEYFSIYANLEKVNVKVGDHVEENTKLGEVLSDINRLHFELWKDKVRLDANKWLETNYD